METSPPKGHRLSGTIRWEEVGSLCEEVGLALSSERRSTQRSQAQLSPRQTALAGPVHSQNGGSDRFELLWVSPPRQISSCAIKHRPYRFFFARLGGTLCAVSGRIWHTSCPFYCNSLPRLRFLRTEDAVEPDHIHPEPCPRCGGVLVFKDTVECPTTGSPVNFFRCDDCGYVHSVERQSA